MESKTSRSSKTNNDTLKNNAKPEMEKLCPKTIADVDRYALYRKQSSACNIIMLQPLMKAQLQIVKNYEEQLTKLLTETPSSGNQFITKKKILVLGMKALFCKTKGEKFEFTVHTSVEEIHIILRPSIEQFISIMSCFYDIVIFSDYSAEFTNQIVQLIDKGKLIKKIYTKSDAIKLGKKMFVKDLRLISPNLSTIVLIDCHIICFSLQPENGILISRFKGEKMDKELMDIGEVLLEIGDVADVRAVLREKYKYIDLI